MKQSFNIVKYYPNNVYIRLFVSLIIFFGTITFIVYLSDYLVYPFMIVLSSILIYILFVRYAIEHTRVIDKIDISKKGIFYKKEYISSKEVKEITLIGESFITVYYTKHRVYKMKIRTNKNEIIFIKVEAYGINLDNNERIKLFDSLNMNNFKYNLKIR